MAKTKKDEKTKLFINDIKKNRKELFTAIRENSSLSFSFAILLLCSSIVATLGLILNSVPVIIGGMIIAPLMWPLLRVSIGLAYTKGKDIFGSFALLLLSTGLTLGTAFLITEISPIKVLNEEILSRTNPTILDTIIAIASGAVASIAIIQPRISSSLAGVAIATSLVPPLCVSGIGLSIGENDIFEGGLLLFLTNIIAIIFIAVLIFTIIGLRQKRGEKPNALALVFVTFILIITSIPLFYFLLNYSYKSEVYEKAETVLTQEFEEISNAINVDNIKTKYDSSGDNIVKIEAEIELPEGLFIDYLQQQQIIKSLEEKLDRKVDLNLILINTISIITEDDINTENDKKTLEETFVEEIKKQTSAEVKNISIEKLNDSWQFSAVLHAEPGYSLTYQQLGNLEEKLSTVINQEVVLNIEILTLTSLKSEENQTIKEIKKELRTYIIQTTEGTDMEIEISALNLKEIDEHNVEIKMEIKAPFEFYLADETMEEIIKSLEEKHSKQISLQIDTVYLDVERY